MYHANSRRFQSSLMYRCDAGMALRIAVDIDIQAFILRFVLPIRSSTHSLGNGASPSESSRTPAAAQHPLGHRLQQNCGSSVGDYFTVVTCLVVC